MRKSLDIVNSADVRALTRKDKVIAQIHKQYGFPPNWSRPPGFISLAQIILEQQVSLASARAHFNKLNGFVREFSPKHILKLTDEEMRACQISRQKALYLRGLSAAILNGEIELEQLHGIHEAEVRSRLTSLKGIGHWTADIYLMFCLQAKDIFPIGDIAVVNTIRRLYSFSDRDEILQFAENWKPYRSLATYFMWHHYLEQRKRKQK